MTEKCARDLIDIGLVPRIVERPHIGKNQALKFARRHRIEYLLPEQRIESPGRLPKQRASSSFSTVYYVELQAEAQQGEVEAAAQAIETRLGGL
jgi:hypothetical protein